MLRLTTFLTALVTLPVFASEDIADQYPASALYSKPVEVIPHVWSAIGAMAPPNYDNAGHNNNLSFIVTGWCDRHQRRCGLHPSQSAAR